LNARLRYFDPARKRAGLPENVAALVSGISDTSATVTLVNLSRATARKVVVQGGAYGEHRIESVAANGKPTHVGARSVEVQLSPGAGTTLVLTMKRYAETPTERFPQ
jgi:hypothetical protein